MILPYGPENASNQVSDTSESVPLEDICNSAINSNATSIAVESDKSVYTPQQDAQISVYTYDDNGCPVSDLVMLQISETNPPYRKVYQQSFFSSGSNVTAGTFSEESVGFVSPGHYNISATLDDGQKTAWKTIEIKEIFYSRQAIMWFIGWGFFAGLIILAVKGVNNPILSEVLRFVFISGIIFSVLFSFIFINEELSGFAPVGIVKKPEQLPPEQVPIDMNAPENIIEEETYYGDGQWVINIGGQPPDYIYGIQIPISVLIFGILGGYLRYLYKTSKLRFSSKDSEGSETTKENQRLNLFYASLEDIALLFLAPLLAIAIWFLLDQMGIQGQDAIQTIAVVSFTIGLITEEAVQALIKFSKSVLGVKEEKSKEQSEHAN
jgi:hypothetical protein